MIGMDSEDLTIFGSNNGKVNVEDDVRQRCNVSLAHMHVCET